MRPDLSRLEALLERHNSLLERQLANDRNWKLKLVNGMVAGLGGFLGATVIVSLAIYLLQPFDGLTPMLDRLTQSAPDKKR